MTQNLNLKGSYPENKSDETMKDPPCQTKVGKVLLLASSRYVYVRFSIVTIASVQPQTCTVAMFYTKSRLLSKCYQLSYASTINTHKHTHIQPFKGPLSKTTRVGRYKKKHSPTHTHPDHQTSNLSTSSIYYDPRNPPCSICVLDSLFPQPPSRGPLRSASWSGTLYFILHTFLHPIIFFSQHMPILSQPALL